MPRVMIAGGGLSGLGAAAALGSAGFHVDVFEARPFLGGRATSYPVTAPDEVPEIIDNCQHVLLRCCVNLLDFYRRLGVADRIRFQREFYFIEPGGRVSILRRGALPAPLHFFESFIRMRCFGNRDRLAIARALLALRIERKRRQDLDRISMLEWLLEKRQTPRAIDRFWKQVLVSAVNEDLDRMAARHGFQVFWLGFLARSDSYEMGVPAVPLGELYAAERWRDVGEIRIHERCPVDSISSCGMTANGTAHQGDYYICALPFERVQSAAPWMDIAPARFEHSPITGIHLWFDRPITSLPHATLLDRTVQWMFNKEGGRYIQLVVSASRNLLDLTRSQVIELALRELAEFLPEAGRAKVSKTHVVKEVRATFSAAPGTESLRPGPGTSAPNVFLAGDWTRSGWPATMEGAVRSGYIAAEAVARAANLPARFVLPDVA
jgi:zeta-carotene desaturase